MSMRKLPAALILAACAALCVLLASCSAPSSGGELGGLTRISLTEHAAGPPGSVFLSRRPWLNRHDLVSYTIVTYRLDINNFSE